MVVGTCGEMAQLGDSWARCTSPPNVRRGVLQAPVDVRAAVRAPRGRAGGVSTAKFEHVGSIENYVVFVPSWDRCEQQE